MSILAFRHITKSASAAGHTSKRMCGQVLVLPSERLVHPAASDDFVNDS